MNNKIIHWSYRDFHCFPKAIFDYREYLEEIYLKENFITSIPLWVFEINNLTFLHLAGNEILFIPEEIWFLKNLEFLDVSGNRLTVLPKTIGSLQKLCSLNVSQNQLSSIPKEIGQLKTLTVFYANNNNLELIPNDLGFCWNLSDISLSDNFMIKEIPGPIFHLPHLKYIDVDRCNLSHLPFIKCVSLSHFRVFENIGLNHIPYYYEMFITPNYAAKNIFNCQQVLGNSFVQVEIKGIERIVNLPKQLLKIHSHEKRIPLSLLELSLGIAYISFNVCNLHGMLPNYLYSLLKQGPVARCGGAFCNIFLFHESYLLIIKRNKRNDYVIISHLFCSKDCLEQWMEDKTCFYNMSQWSFVNINKLYQL